MGRHRIESGIPLGISTSSHNGQECPAYRSFTESLPRQEERVHNACNVYKIQQWRIGKWVKKLRLEKRALEGEYDYGYLGSIGWTDRRIGERWQEAKQMLRIFTYHRDILLSTANSIALFTDSRCRVLRNQVATDETRVYRGGLRYCSDGSEA